MVLGRYQAENPDMLAFKKKVIRFLSDVAPQKLQENLYVERLLLKYRGSEKVLVDMLRQQVRENGAERTKGRVWCRQLVLVSSGWPATDDRAPRAHEQAYHLLAHKGARCRHAGCCV